MIWLIQYVLDVELSFHIKYGVLCGLQLIRTQRSISICQTQEEKKGKTLSNHFVSIRMIYHSVLCGLWLGYLGATGVGSEHSTNDRDSGSRHRSGATLLLLHSPFHISLHRPLVFVICANQISNDRDGHQKETARSK